MWMFVFLNGMDYVVFFIYIAYTINLLKYMMCVYVYVCVEWRWMNDWLTLWFLHTSHRRLSFISSVCFLFCFLFFLSYVILYFITNLNIYLRVCCVSSQCTHIVYLNGGYTKILRCENTKKKIYTIYSGMCVYNFICKVFAHVTLSENM